MKHLLICVLMLPVFFRTAAQLTQLRAGMKITSSVTVLPKVYYLNTKAAGDSSSIIEISGNDIVIDFNNAVMDGNINNRLPNEFYGMAIFIKGGKNITIKNLKAKGYKVALRAKEVEHLIIEHCDLSYNYRQHLNSTQQKEDLGDWMSYHQNERDEWLRYGAAIYLRGCDNATIHDNTVTGGQCALMLTACNDGLIFNNNLSFNSGIGIGMYRCNRNKVVYNKLDFNVRGHSEGVYNRGQDSAAILVFEQCNDNVFAYNSATHSGDGFFLWAGQYTMDTGEGGCNDNLIFQNDFSYAPTNGVEVTFSRNQIIGNRIKQCDNGIWGGYSYNTKIWGNQFEKNQVGIAIEHGQKNEILFNKFINNGQSIKLWAREQQPANWGYARKRNTRSVGYLIAGNGFTSSVAPIHITVTDSIKLGYNEFTGTNRKLTIGDLVHGVDSSEDFKDALKRKYDSSIELNIPPNNHYWGYTQLQNNFPNRTQIHVSEWGPYDFLSPFLWNTNPTGSTDTMRFSIIGPKGKWKIINQRGLKNCSLKRGTIPESLIAVKTNEKGQDVFLEMEYQGENITTPFGKKIVGGRPYRFSYRNPLIPLWWVVNWYAIDSTNNPLIHPERSKGDLKKNAPIQTAQTTELNYAWWGGLGKEKKYEQFYTIAEADIDLPAGEYEWGVTWDDTVRLSIDGHLLVDEWNPSKYRFDESPHTEVRMRLVGKHHIKVEHVELGGFATLIVKLKKR